MEGIYITILIETVYKIRYGILLYHMFSVQCSMYNVHCILYLYVYVVVGNTKKSPKRPPRLRNVNDARTFRNFIPPILVNYNFPDTHIRKQRKQAVYIIIYIYINITHISILDKQFVVRNGYTITSNRFVGIYIYTNVYTMTYDYDI